MDELDDKLQELANEYHVPDAAPRDRMWERIAARREARGRRQEASEPIRLTLAPRPSPLAASSNGASASPRRSCSAC